MKTECNAVFLFIAELTGSFVPGTGTVDTKIICGQQDYIHTYSHDLDLDCEKDRKELHENVWLQRLYRDLDSYFALPAANALMRTLALEGDYRDDSYAWTVPTELDASASMLQYEGLLTGDSRLLEMTNVIGDTLQDPWKLEGMPRLMLKLAATPMLYGSSKACFEHWQNNNISYDKDDIILYNKEITEGPFGVANLLKEFIINNAQPQATMKVKVWNETFMISCNRFRNVGERTKAYKIWDSTDQQYNVVLHTDTKKVPDLKQFRRYMVTLLVHNLDSQVANTVIGKVMDKYGWGVPIHDAFLVSPAAAADTRRWYGEELTKIYEDRDVILADFFNSIGITAAATDQWKALQAKVVPLTGEFHVNPMALK
jgi:hypothetical protein